MTIQLVVDNDDFKKKLTQAGSKLVMVDFFANWCGPCVTIGPQLEELAAEFINSLIVLKVDVDECYDIADKYNVTSVPTFFMIKESKSLEHFIGADFKKLRASINKHM